MLKKTLLGLSLALVGLSSFALSAEAPAPAATTPPAATAPASNPKLEDIKKLLKVTAATSSTEDGIKQMLDMMKAQSPGVKPEVWDELAKEIKVEELIDKIALVYDKHLGHDEIKALLKFYETPEGQKISAALPKIMTDSMKAGQEWGMQLAPKIMKRIQEKGGN